MALARRGALAIPFVLGVRDWRCYGLVLLWPPVISAIQTGERDALARALAAALAWRFRDRLLVPCRPASVGDARREVLPVAARGLARCDAAACATAAARRAWSVARCSSLSWGAIGFAGLARLPGPAPAARGRGGRGLVHRCTSSGSISACRPPVARLALAGGRSRRCSLRSSWLGRRGDERSAFILAIAASLALTPIVWLHYFALLVVVVALAQPRLGVRLVRPARDGRHARERASDAVRDVAVTLVRRPRADDRARACAHAWASGARDAAASLAVRRRPGAAA